MQYNQIKLLTLNIIENCDAACCYCSYWRVKTTPPSFKDLIRAIDEAISMGAIGIRLSGGEPLLRNDLAHLVSYINIHGLISMVCTSAKYNLNSLIELVDAGIDILSISLDTIEPGCFQNIRGYSITPVISNIETLAKLRDRGFEIVISTVLTKLCIDGLCDLLEYAQQHDLVLNLTPFQTDGTKNMQRLIFKEYHHSFLNEAMLRVKESASKGLRIINSDEYLDHVVNYLTLRKLPDGYMCQAGEATAIITAEGKVKLCHSLKPLPFRSLKESWLSREADELRKRMLRLDCPRCWLSCHAGMRRHIPHRYGREKIWEVI